MAHDAVSLAELAKAFGWDFENAKITTEKVGDHPYVLFGIGGKNDERIDLVHFGPGAYLSLTRD